MDELSDELQELLFVGLDHGVDGVRDGPLVPFVLVDGPDGRRIHRIVDGTPEQIDLEGSVVRAVEFTREQMNKQPHVRMVLVYDAYLRLEGERFDAVFVEGVDQGAVRAVAAQPYRPSTSPEGFETLGDPALLPAEMGRLREG